MEHLLNIKFMILFNGKFYDNNIKKKQSITICKIGPVTGRENVKKMLIYKNNDLK